MMGAGSGLGGFNGMGTGMGFSGPSAFAPAPAPARPQAPTVFTDDKSIMRYNKSNVPQVVKKLREAL